MPELELRGRTAVITGAASGIGRALAVEAGMRGMSVAIADVNADGLAETEKMLAERQVQVLIHPLDVRNADAVQDFADACFERFSSVALVWANAGINRYDSAVRPNLDVWNEVLDVNLRGPINCMAAFVGRLVDKGEPARFIFTGSQASFVAAPEIGPYVAAKHGLWGIADTLRMELAQLGTPVGASLLAPPRAATPMISVTTDRVRAAGGDEALKDFIAALPTAESVAVFATDGAARGDFLLLPDYEVRDMLRERVAALI